MVPFTELFVIELKTQQQAQSNEHITSNVDTQLRAKIHQRSAYMLRLKICGNCVILCLFLLALIWNCASLLFHDLAKNVVLWTKLNSQIKTIQIRIKNNNPNHDMTIRFVFFFRGAAIHFFKPSQCTTTSPSQIQLNDDFTKNKKLNHNNFSVYLVFAVVAKRYTAENNLKAEIIDETRHKT